MKFTKGNRALRDHLQNRKSVLLFEQVKNKKGWLKYFGEMEYVDAQTVDAPDRRGNTRKAILFELKPTALDAPLRYAETAATIRENLQRFNAECEYWAGRSHLIISQATYWIYDEELDQFSPSKFSAYRGMSFELYERSLQGEAAGAHFDGNAARVQIEKILSQSFVADRGLSARLKQWVNRTFAGWSHDTSKAAFVRLRASRQYWAFSANPSIYDLVGAVEKLHEEYWTVKESDVRAGDRAILWKAKGNTATRGIVGFAEVLTDPKEVSLTPAQAAFCIAPDLLQPARRVKFRMVRGTRLPIWAENNLLVQDLSVARATGGSVFRVTPEQWHAVVEAAAPNFEDSEDDQKFKLVQVRQTSSTGRGSRGFNSDPVERKAIELFAVRQARQHYEKDGYLVEEFGKPFDLRCTRGSEVLFIEVKGTQGFGEEVPLTPNEVAFADEHPTTMELFQVWDIQLTSGELAPECSGGQVTIVKPWVIDRDLLTPTGYSYAIKKKAKGAKASQSSSCAPIVTLAKRKC
jgi:hypothetical protein